MAGSSASSSQGGGRERRGGSLLALFIYFGIFVLLLGAFAVINFVAVSAPVPERIGFFP